MSISKKTESQLEEVYERNLQYNKFNKERSPELYEMCKNCENYLSEEHDYTECRDRQCFKNWLALEYLEWMNEYK